MFTTNSTNSVNISTQISSQKLSPLHEKWRQRIEQVLSQRLPSADATPQRLHRAMRYSTLNGGKRIRGMLVYATGHLLGADDAVLDIPACAIEAIQCFSLIHDDLPVLDNDDLRRGKPSCHRAFDEATAILAGDALQMFAFQQLSNGPQDADQILAMIRILSEASGSAGMIGGGSLELEISGKQIEAEALEDLHWQKCGALIRASILLGAYGATLPDQDILSKLEAYAYGIGVGYQISNDLLDGMGNFALLGKKPKSDQAVGRSTFFTKFDPEQSILRMVELFNQSIAALDGLERAEPLREIVQYIMERTLSICTVEQINSNRLNYGCSK